jgi:hypothetical protein
MNKRPIVIVASARSGSSAFASYVGRMHKIKIWSEPSFNIEGLESFKKWLKAENTNYVLKIITYQLVDNELFQTILKTDCYKIKLTRSNKVEQIASHYIGHCTDIWNAPDKYARGTEYTVPVDLTLINSIINVVVTNDKLFDSFDIKFDETLTYEELISTINLDNTGVVKIIPPTNYNEIKRVIEEEYAKHG